MANNSSTSGLTKFADLKRRLLFLIGALIVYRIGAHIPVPGVDPVALAKSFESVNNGLLGMFNMFSGGALSRFTVFAIGIMPYISSSIIMQLASEIVPSLKSLKKEGEAGRRKITKFTRIGTVILGTAQSFAVAVFVYQQPGLVTIPQYEFYLSAVICLVTGTMFLMWLGEQITERGIGNGISLIICSGIAAGIPGAIGQVLTLAGNTDNYVVPILFFVGAAVITYAVVFIESGQRKIPVQYAKRQVGNKIMQGQSTHMPYKLNMAGVIPPIFASSIILFPSTILSWLGSSDSFPWLRTLSVYLQQGQPLYILFFISAIIFFCFFYTALVFNPRDVAENLKKSGAFIPGIRPGEQTSKYIEKVILRLTLGGAIYITVVCVMPELLHSFVPSLGGVSFGGTSLLIMVVVTMDFRTQIASYMMSHQYEHLMKKTNFKGVSRK